MTLRATFLLKTFVHISDKLMLRREIVPSEFFLDPVMCYNPTPNINGNFYQYATTWNKIGAF